jgi:hemerythrin
MLEWKSDYETGVLAIDSQHKVLFDHINRLGKLLEQATIEGSEMDNLLIFLEDYARQHFNSEETCMARFRCPAYARNKEDHGLFLNVLKFYKGEYEVTSRPKEMLERLHESMVWWINQHILKVDIQLKDFVGVKQDVG